MKRIALPFLMLLPIIGSAQAPVDARELLLHADEALFKAASFHLAGTITVDMATDLPYHGQIDFSLFQRGIKARREFMVNGSKGVDIFDGSTRTMYTEPSAPYSRSAGSGYSPMELTALRFGRNPENLLKASLAPSETLVFAGKETPCYVVRAVYRWAPVAIPVQQSERKVWIGQEGNLVLRDTWEFTVGTGGTPNALFTETINYTAIEPGAPVADSMFIPRPPVDGTSFAPFERAAGRTCVTCPDFGNPFVPDASNAAAVKQLVMAEAPKSIVAVPVRAIPSGFPYLTDRTDAEYTPEARAAGLQGTVTLNLKLDADGTPADIRVLESLGMGLDEKAVESIRKWRIKPSESVRRSPDGELLAVVMFHLDQAAPWRVAAATYSINSAVGKIETLVKPVLTYYVSPDAAGCPARGGGALVQMVVREDGTPDVAPPLGDNPLLAAVFRSVSVWRFRPGTADGKSRAANAMVELECGTPADAPALIYRVENGVMAPRVLYRPEPEYSEEGRRAKMQGEVTLSMVVDAWGFAQNIQVIKSLGAGLDEKAIEAVSTWRFKPAMKDGHPVAIQTVTSIAFRLL